MEKVFLEDLPPEMRPGRPRFDWDGAAEMLRQRPWSWMIMRDSAPKSTITQLRAGKLRAFRPPSDYEFRIIGSGNRVVLLGMFVGAPKPPDFDSRPQP